MSRASRYSVAMGGTLVTAIIIGCGRDVSEPSPQTSRDSSSPQSQLAKQLGPADATNEISQLPQHEPAETDAATEAMVRVQVWDETDRIPLPENSEVWFRGRGSWWLKPATAFGSAAEDLGRRKIGHNDTIALYPDGRNGQEIFIPFSMTAEMNPNGSTRDSIIITIGDDEIEIVGLPIEAATGNATIKVKRGG